MSEVKKHIVAIIGARSGSTGLKDKNIRHVCGVPLIGHAVQLAKQSKLIDDVVLSTDSELYAQVGRAYGARTPFLRPADHANNQASAESFLKHAVCWLEENEGSKIDIVVYLQCTDLFRKAEWIDVLVEKLIANPELESAFVAYPTHKNFWRKTDAGYERLTSVDYAPRQIGSTLFREDTGLGCATRASVIKQGRRLGDHVWILENDDEAAAIDIHTEQDLWHAEIMMRKKIEANEMPAVLPATDDPT